MIRNDIVEPLTDFCVKSGGNIDASIASTYLENFEDLSTKGIDKEIASTVAGMVYFGERSRSSRELGPYLTMCCRHVGDGACGGFFCSLVVLNFSPDQRHSE